MKFAFWACFRLNCRSILGEGLGESRIWEDVHMQYLNALCTSNYQENAMSVIIQFTEKCWLASIIVQMHIEKTKS